MLKHKVREFLSTLRLYLRNIKSPEWYKESAGSLWSEIGELQFKFLVRGGLKPDHYLLDIGCGALRGGIHFIRYLKPKHYSGVDKDPVLIKAGIKETRLTIQGASANVFLMILIFQGLMLNLIMLLLLAFLHIYHLMILYVVW